MNELIKFIVLALRQITTPRYFISERGFAAEFYCQLRDQLKGSTIFPEHAILESEVQKRVSPHGIRQRPDIIIHIPVETDYTENVNQNNFVVFAFKLDGDVGKVEEDFGKLDEMISYLNYHNGVFINIGSYPTVNLLEYKGNYQSQIHDFSIRLQNGNVEILHSFFRNGEVVSEEK
jgi:hypothetical protein